LPGRIQKEKCESGYGENSCSGRFKREILRTKCGAYLGVKGSRKETKLHRKVERWAPESNHNLDVQEKKKRGEKEPIHLMTIQARDADFSVNRERAAHGER